MTDKELITFLQAKVGALAQDFSRCYDSLLDATGRVAVLEARVAELEPKPEPPAA